jgi:hypothetical protein
LRLRHTLTQLRPGSKLPSLRNQFGVNITP